MLPRRKFLFFGLFIVFFLRYSTEFGFTIPDRAIIVDDIRVRGTGRSSIDQTFESVYTTDTPTVENVS
jgi:5-oxoprolinase (ATP-hydrolysing)